MMKESRETLTWTKRETTGDIPDSISGHSAIIHKENMYIFGGYTGAKCLNTVHKLNLQTWTWKLLLSQAIHPTARTAHSVTYVSEIGEMFIFGGSGENISKSNKNDLWAFNLCQECWREVENRGERPTPRYGHSMTLFNDGLYVFGGTSGFVYLNDLYRYDLLTKIWMKIPTKGKIPKGSYKHELILINKSMYLIGGIADTERFSDVFVYNIPKNEWTSLALESKPKQYVGRYAQSAIISQGKIILFGGSDTNKYNSLLIFNIEQKKLDILRPSQANFVLPEHRDFHTAAVYENSMIIFGGSGNLGRYNDVHEWTLADKLPNCSLASDMGSLLEFVEEEHIFNDLKIICKKQEGELVESALYTYRALIKERTPNLLNLHHTNIIEVNISKKAMKILLEYIYSDKINCPMASHDNLRELALFCLEQHIIEPLFIILRYFLLILSKDTFFATILFGYDIDSESRNKKDSLTSTTHKLCHQFYLGNLKFGIAHHKALESKEEYPRLIKVISGTLRTAAREQEEAKVRSTEERKFGNVNLTQGVKSGGNSPSPEIIVLSTHIFKGSKSYFLENMKGLFASSQNTYDICLRLPNKELIINAHMFILVARSQYFRNLLAFRELKQEEEKKYEETTIDLTPGCTKKLFQTFIKYLYQGDSGLAKIDPQEVLYLIELADFYSLSNDRLKLLCQPGDHAFSIDQSNIIELLEIADTFSLEKLKANAVHYLLNNFYIIPKLEGLSGLSSEILSEILVLKALQDEKGLKSNK